MTLMNDETRMTNDQTLRPDGVADRALQCFVIRHSDVVIPAAAGAPA
jgi:hypothetical protein